MKLYTIEKEHISLILLEENLWAVLHHLGDGHFNIYCPSQILIPSDVNDYVLDSDKTYLRYFIISYCCCRLLDSRAKDKIHIHFMPCAQAAQLFGNVYFTLGILIELCKGNNPSSKSFKISEIPVKLLEIFDSNKIIPFSGSVNRMHNALTVPIVTLNVYFCCRLPFVPKQKVVSCKKCSGLYHQRCLQIDDDDFASWVCKSCYVPEITTSEICLSMDLSWGGSFKGYRLIDTCSVDSFLTLFFVIDTLSDQNLQNYLNQYTKIEHEILLESNSLLSDIDKILKKDSMDPIECLLTFPEKSL